MQPISNKKWLILLIAVAFVLFGLKLIFFTSEPEPAPPIEEEVVVVHEYPEQKIIGSSHEGREIESFTYRKEGIAEDNAHLVFVGGIHGGYEWNTVILAYEVMDYLESNPEVLPENITVTIIPSLNPDGVYKVIGKEGRFTTADAPPTPETVPGRFNANGVDLNRNFACRWQPESTWRGNKVSAGEYAFSEPEAAAMRDFVFNEDPSAVIFWHSQANAVYASQCGEGVLPETTDIMNLYAKASGYRAIETFDAYPVTGDVESWLASVGIPSVSVELKTHEDVEFEKNKAGVLALFEYYSE